MGEAAMQRRSKRMKYLTRLAKEEPERFEKEWEKRLSSWMEVIRKDAGRLRGRNKKPVRPVFERVDEALWILRSCGDAIYKKYSGETWDLLSTECCRQFGIRVDKHLFRLNHYP